jgi:PHS family inorganic phosphate transporter-like MFS transporter
MGLENFCASIVFLILLRAFNSAIASDLSCLQWTWRLLLGIDIAPACLTCMPGF